MIAGIDIGSTTTKAVTVDSASNQILNLVTTKANDAVTSATGALGKMILENNITMSDIEKIMITGVGASKINQNIFGIPTIKVNEIQAVGIGGMYLGSGLGEALSKNGEIIIANIGTGTAIIDASPTKIEHIGGTGLGGGTIIGLGKRFLGMSDYTEIVSMAEKGSLNNVDLLMEDIMDTSLSFLSAKSTAANFAKMLDTATDEDIAIGLINMVYQVIGVLSVFAARNKGASSVLVTGSGSGNMLGREVFKVITGLYGTQFEYPEHPEYSTAIGAALHK
ncbi:MAG: pantothenate kinase [Spirochaetaceae bacterium]|jgi:type II pantothenate kinase|nr:pantothenate kinase [Spirochaetaceae bacterium]